MKPYGMCQKAYGNDSKKAYPDYGRPRDDYTFHFKTEAEAYDYHVSVVNALGY